MDQSRRKLLKILAGAPMLLTVGFAGEALMRFAKPSMAQNGLFDPADEPEQIIKAKFTKDMFPEPWTCLPFMYNLKYKVFSPQQEEIRRTPAFIVRLPDDQFVAFNRECPRGRGCYLNYVTESIENCGCGTAGKQCCCAMKTDHPVFVCCCHMDVYDTVTGECLRGPSPQRPKRIDVIVQGDHITLGRMEQFWIV